ncbi:MAG: imidazolonepropionase [Saprospiraceae bacterium]|nr:imidazolonepropionase [Saprospiraceae bacterium]MCB0681277.1 imidazolonepropionase [Saprospiraceae bacterium]
MLIHHIRELVGLRPTPAGPLRGAALGELSTISDAFLLIEGDRIAAFGPMSEAPPRADLSIDANGQLLFPAWVDSHTHLVFAGSREGEFEDRIRGLSYEEIAARGGGILNSAARLQDTPEEELVEQALNRLQEVIGYGTGAIEIKSGYGLTVAAELKMLRVIRRLKELSPLPIRATFLGAHAVPKAFRDLREGYLRLVIDEMLPRIAGEGLADYIDVFCEKIAFSPAEMDRILEAGQRYGLRPKVHVNQFFSLGGIPTAVARNALSVDHLEVVGGADMEVLRDSPTIATLLPSAPFFLNDHYPPARQLIDNDIAVALATDFNPGSTPSGRMPFVLSLACIKMRMSPAEAVNAATINGAFALELEADYGSIAVGKKANLFLTKPIPSVGYLPYAFGSDLVETVVLNGEVV